MLPPAALAALLLTAPGDPPPHPAVGTRLAPTDVDWEHPAWRTTFDDPAELAQWRLEGGRQISIADGRLVLESTHQGPTSVAEDDHLVAWLDRELPGDFLLEFSLRPQNRQQGLNIVFFNTRGLHGESVFDPALAPRDGLFKQYHSGDLNGYHLSDWAGDRGSANVRKNKGFKLVASGPDRIAAAPAEAWSVVRLYKRGGLIRLAVDDVIAVGFDDDGQTWGPVWNHPGWIGLRQMAHTVRCEYDHLTVWPLH
ncbi:MAG: DUF1961 family protein [Fimbriimonadaceae bacterium]|nr:DUF1961 family protein [Fimbriimonadaceae bacterium]